MHIPVNEPLLGQRELDYVADCIRSGWVSSAGEYIRRFEQGWAELCGRRWGVAVSNGTVALELALEALNLEPGDEVILPTFTIVSCVAAVLRAGAVPVLVDSEPQTWCMDVGQVAARITPRTRVVMPVHIYGHPVDMDPLLDLAERHGLFVVEDAAEAHGAQYWSERSGTEREWRRCGSFGELSCFSFYANKLITTGEGGMVLTDSSDLAENLRSLRNLCFQPGQRFVHERVGFNARLTNLQAALGVAQVERAEEIIERKRWIGREYLRRLGGLVRLQLQVERQWARSVFWMFGVVIDEATGLSGSQLAERLARCGIETRPFFLGMHEQPVFRRQGLFAGERFPIAERLSRQGIYLPTGLGLTEEQVEFVCRAVEEAVG